MPYVNLTCCGFFVLFFCRLNTVFPNVQAAVKRREQSLQVKGNNSPLATASCQVFTVSLLHLTLLCIQRASQRAPSSSAPVIG